MNAPSVLSLGEVLWDLFPEGARFGGAPANFACHAALLGAEVTMASAVGDDPRGGAAVEILEGFGIDASLVQRHEEVPTGSVGVTLDASGKPSFEIHQPAAWDRMAWSSMLEKCVRRSDTVYFGTLGQRSPEARESIRGALRVAKEAGVSRMLDVNLRSPFFDDALIRESIELASWVKLSDEELPVVATACGLDPIAAPERALRQLLERFELDVAIMTRGAEGALLLSPGETVDQPGIPVDVCDTVGAGDSFTAACVVGLLRGDALIKIARDACEVAAAVCAHSGAVPERE